MTLVVTFGSSTAALSSRPSASSRASSGVFGIAESIPAIAPTIRAARRNSMADSQAVRLTNASSTRWVVRLLLRVTLPGLLLDQALGVAVGRVLVGQHLRLGLTRATDAPIPDCHL